MLNITWGEMFSYLEKQENCRVNGQGFFIPDLYVTLSRYKEMIDLHDPDQRAINLHCKSLKGSLRRIYDNHKSGNIQPPNTYKKNRFGIGGF